MSSSEKPQRFMTWRDLILTPIVTSVTLLVPLGLVFAVHRHAPLSLFAGLLLYMAFLTAFTLLVQKVIRSIVPFNPGTYGPEDAPTVIYAWNLHQFLSIVNLGWHHTNALIPSPFRKLMYGLMGARFGKGIIPISGRLLDPYNVTIEQEAIIGEDALVLGHALTGGKPGKLIIGPVHVGKGAVVGARSMVMPNVTIGENAMIKAMSLVPMNTTIGPNEIWAGIPARKVGDF